MTTVWLEDGSLYRFNYPIENYDSQEPASCKHKRFMEILGKHSLDHENAIGEWTMLKVRFEKKGIRSKCICSHPIETNYFVENPYTKTTLCVGSECINRWINPTLRCENCDEILSNVIHRIQKKNFLCRVCNLQKKREEIERKLAEERKQIKIQTMGNWVLFWYGKYKYKPFKLIKDDLEYVEYLMNIPPEKRTESVKAFQEYARLLFEFEDIEVEVECD